MHRRHDLREDDPIPVAGSSFKSQAMVYSSSSGKMDEVFWTTLTISIAMRHGQSTEVLRTV